MNKQEFRATSWRSNQGYTAMQQHGQPTNHQNDSCCLKRWIELEIWGPFPYVKTFLMYRHSLCTDIPYVQTFLKYRHSLCTNIPYVQTILMYRHSLCTNIPYVQTFLMYRLSWCTDIPYAQTFLIYRRSLCRDIPYVQTFLMYRHSLCTDIPYVQTFPMYRHSLCTDIPYVQTFLMYRHSLCTDVPYVQTFPEFSSLKLWNFQTCAILKEKTDIIKILKSASEIPLREFKGKKEDNGGWRILMGDDRGKRGGHATVDQVYCAGFWVSTGLLRNTYMFHQSYRQFRLAENSVS
jgi:hypothetical protein